MPRRFPVAVDTRAPHGETNAYLLGRDDSLLVDPAGRTPELDAAVSPPGESGDASPIEHVAVTHAHPDHVGAVAEYARETNATVWAHAAFTERFERATGVPPDRVFRPGDELDDTGVSVLDTPGHTPDHAAFVENREAGDTGKPGDTDKPGDTCVDAVVGDLVFAGGSVFVGGEDGDLRAYLASLRRVATRNFDRLHPGHGPVVDAPRRRLHDLHAHRRERERRILAAVHDGCSTVPDIRDHAYDKDLAGVRDLADDAVRAHLDKLRVENRVEWDGEQARPAGRR